MENTSLKKYDTPLTSALGPVLIIFSVIPVSSGFVDKKPSVLIVGAVIAFIGFVFVIIGKIQKSRVTKNEKEWSNYKNILHLIYNLL